MSISADPLFVKVEVAYRQERYSRANSGTSEIRPASPRRMPRWPSRRRRSAVRPA